MKPKPALLLILLTAASLVFLTIAWNMYSDGKVCCREQKESTPSGGGNDEIQLRSIHLIASSRN